MESKSVIVIAEEHDQEFYRTLFLEKDAIEFVHPGEALHVLKNKDAGIVFLDCGYYPDEGLKLLKDIKKASHSTPVIFLTDFSTFDIVVKAFRSGVRDYFRKPASINELSNTVKNVLTARSATREKRIPLFMDDIYDREVPLISPNLGSLINEYSSRMC